jgi:hypothetical protein
VYDEDKNNPTLHLGIKKNGDDFIHLSIHLSLNELKDSSAGMIHIKKDIYKNLKPTQLLISKTKFKNFLYALIAVKVPENKLNSLEFSIDDQEFITPHVKKEFLCDSEIKNESIAMINVLNKLFDENNKEMFIGEVSRNIPHKYNTRNPFPIHNKTNLILKGINAHTNHFTRKNKGSRMEPLESKEQTLTHKRNRKKSFRAIREERLKKSSKLTRKSNRVQPNRNPYTNTYNLSPNNINKLDS